MTVTAVADAMGSRGYLPGEPESMGSRGWILGYAAEEHPEYLLEDLQMKYLDDYRRLNFQLWRPTP